MRHNRNWLSTLFCTVVVLGLNADVSPASAQGMVTAEVVLASATTSTLTVDITVDVTETDPAKLLGSFTATLQWDMEILRFESHSGIQAPFTGVVNDRNAGLGQLAFNGASATGSAGKSTVLSITFTVIAAGAGTRLDLEFTAMLAATDFTNLLPLLAVKDGELVTTVQGGSEGAGLPKDFSLGKNFPNPFNPETTITYALPRQSEVKIKIFNALGQPIRTLEQGLRQAGHYRVQWDGKNDNGLQVGSGLYFYRLKAGDFIQTRRMLLLK